MGHNVICDRYLWSGLSYAYVHSPNCYALLKEVYLNQVLFQSPDLYIFVDTPVDVCYDRRPDGNIEDRKAIRAAYLMTRKYLHTPVITVSSVGGEDRALQILVEKFTEYVEVNNLCLE
jgi:thymidylate kinase